MALKIDTLQVALLCDERAGRVTLPKEAIESLVENAPHDIKRIALLGGFEADSFNTNHAIYLYDIDANRWTVAVLGVVTFTRDSYSGTLFDGSAVICKIASSAADDKVYIFHAERLGTDNAVILEDLGPEAVTAALRNYSSLVTLPDGKLLRIDNDMRFEQGATKGAIFNPKTRQWTSFDPPRVRDYALNIALPNGDVFICGGYMEGEPLIVESECYIYHPSTNTLDRVADMRHRRVHHAGCMLPNGNIFVCGGMGYSEIAAPTHGLDNDRRTLLQTCEEYDFATNRWAYLSRPSDASRAYTLKTAAESYLTNVHAAARDHHTCTLMKNGKIFISGGNGVRARCEIYDPEKGTFKPAAEFPVSIVNYVTVPLTL
jgi:hypothetical protein